MKNQNKEKINKVMNIIGKYLKRILIVTAICYMLLNLISIVMIRKDYNNNINNTLLRIDKENTLEEFTNWDSNLNSKIIKEYGENAPKTLIAYYQGFFYGIFNIILIQSRVLGASIITGIILGILSFHFKKIIEKKKILKTKNK